MTSEHRTITAIVTGSSSGIGRDVARAFLEKGGNVVLNGRDPEKLARVAAELGSEERIAVAQAAAARTVCHPT